jgi:hypothetical protein
VEQVVLVVEAAGPEHELADLPQSVARVVLVPCLLQDGVDIHARDLQRNGRVRRVLADGEGRRQHFENTQRRSRR